MLQLLSELRFQTNSYSNGKYDISVSAYVYDPVADLDYPEEGPITTTIVNGNAGGAEILNQGFEGGLGWSNGSAKDWRRDSNGTPSGSTGPSSASAGDWYAYMETSAGDANSTGQTASLVSPLFDANGGFVTFDYHMYGADIGTLRLQILNHGNWHTLWEQSGQKTNSSSDDWSSALVSMSDFSGDSKLRFIGIAAGGYRGDIAIDNIGYISFGFSEQFNVFRKGSTIALTKGTWPSIGDIQLRYNTGAYRVGTVTGTSGWQSAPIDLFYGDVNLDGAVDVILKNIDEVISGGFDQILYADPSRESAALSITAVDNKFKSFFGQLSNWMTDELHIENIEPKKRDVSVNTNRSEWFGSGTNYLGTFITLGVCESRVQNGSFCTVSFQHPISCIQFVVGLDDTANPVETSVRNVCEDTYQVWTQSVGSRTIEVLDLSDVNADAVEATETIGKVFESGEQDISNFDIAKTEEILSDILDANIVLPPLNSSLPTVIVSDAIPLPGTDVDVDKRAKLSWFGRILQVFNVLAMAEVVEELVDSNRPIMHYTTLDGFAGITASQTINPPGSSNAFFSHLAYPNSDAAMDALSLCGADRAGFFLMNSSNIIGLTPFTTVDPLVCPDGTARPGGGPEATAPVPIPLGTARWVPFIQ